MHNTIFKLRYCKKTEQLKPASEQDARAYELFKARLKDELTVEAYMEVLDENSTRPQLNKLHKLIRELSVHTGITLNDLKEVVKKEAGLYHYDETGICFKSFADCTKSEMSYAIQVVINIGYKADFPLD
jgi:hypothetical protein